MVALTIPQTAMTTLYSSPEDTEFGNVLWSIIRKPSIPDKPLFSGDTQAITTQRHRSLKATWEETIKNKNDRGTRKGLSLDDFIKMVNQLYGVSSEEDAILNRSALHRLIQTGNPKIRAYAKSLNHGALKVVAQFSENWSYGDLVEIGNKVLEETANLHTPLKRDRSENATNIQSVKNLLRRQVEIHGYESFLSKGITAEDILEILTKDEPKLGLEVLIVLPHILGMTPETFLNLTMPNQDESQG